MNVLVTGGAGFIGSHLLDRLVAGGHSIVVIDNCSTGRKENISHLEGKVHFVEADIRDASGIDHAFQGIEIVYHLAALADIVPSIEQPKAYYESNVAGTFNVLEASRRHGIKKLVYVASSSCYGMPDIVPTPETADIRPQYPYALTKRLGEELVMHWGQVYGIPVVSLRPFNVYGPRSRTSGTYGAMFGVFLAQKLAGEPFTVVGDGSQSRDFVHVKDIVRAFVMAGESDVAQQSFNVAMGQPRTVNEVMDLLGGEKVHIPKRPGEPDITHGDIRKIQSQLGWSPTISLEEGVKDLLANIDYWRQAPVWNPQTIAEATKTWFTYLS